MNCPRDADIRPYLIYICRQRRSGFVCTRKKWHRGRHHAHGTDCCFLTWGEEEMWKVKDAGEVQKARGGVQDECS